MPDQPHDPPLPPPPPPPSAGKTLFRAWSRQVAKLSPPGAILAESSAICDQLVAICGEVTPKSDQPTLMLYVPIRGEIDPIMLASWAFPAGWRVCVGMGTDRDSPLQAVTLPFEAIAGQLWHLDTCEQDAWGMAVPRDRVPVRLASIDAVVVPGLVFDESCHRLGRGAGVYDRFLAALDPSTRRIGVVPDARVVPQLPADSHDIPMHMVVTERRVIRSRA